MHVLQHTAVGTYGLPRIELTIQTVIDDSVPGFVGPLLL